MKIRRGTTRRVLAAIVGVEAFFFLLAAFLHTGARVAGLPPFLQDPRIVGATVVEGMCGVFLGIAACVVLVRGTRAWMIAAGAHVFSIVADLFGMTVIALGFGPDSPFNFLFHRVGLAVLLLVLASMLSPTVRNALAAEAGGC